MNRAARWLRLRPWTRHSLVLIVLGAVFIVVGFSYGYADPVPAREAALYIALKWMPMRAWGTIFMICGALAMLSARWPPTSEKWGYATLAGLTTMWGGWYFVSWVGSGSLLALTAALVWWIVPFLLWAIAGLENPRADRRE